MLFDFLKKICNKKKSITFTFTGKDTKDISLDIYYKQCNPEYIASIIYALNHGLFLGKIVQSLMDHKDTNYNNQILAKLDQLYVLEQQDDILVKPLETFEKNVK